MAMTIEQVSHDLYTSPLAILIRGRELSAVIDAHLAQHTATVTKLRESLKIATRCIETGGDMPIGWDLDRLCEPLSADPADPADVNIVRKRFDDILDTAKARKELRRDNE